jgi:hypothetical protein
VTDRTGYIGNTFGPKGFSRGCRVFSSRSKYPKIIVHKADQPDIVVNFFDSDSLAAKTASMWIISEYAVRHNPGRHC